MKIAQLLILSMFCISPTLEAVELSLGVAELPPCPTARWEENGKYGFNAPSRSQARQTIRVKAIVEGENLENSIVLAQVQECAKSASQRVNLQFLVTAPSEGNTLFKNIFAQCMETKRVPVRIHFISLKLEGYCERLSISLPAAKFSRAERVAVATGQVARYGDGVVLNAPPYASGPNAAEYEFFAPSSGIYRFDAEYASAERRPLVVSINQVVVSRAGLVDITGCWEPTCQQWMNQGLVRLREGHNVLRVETANVFPHIRTFRFTPTE
jgi:hypothetical protein